ncbi:hypothetical protein H6G45_00750 [Synechocystis sp. FACHB-383]|uniref:hypothetical protein n=1 Tax=Synechocystis sp. FACHB-383 TaxID=2692864 RepID=UPI001681EB1A|nr:hypothetical protein [Synechocystis sp. FACHB-383]MBD2652042.1 hypothetical protein [Synechocystis sp. FACHB-383]
MTIPHQAIGGEVPGNIYTALHRITFLSLDKYLVYARFTRARKLGDNVADIAGQWWRG